MALVLVHVVITCTEEGSNTHGLDYCDNIMSSTKEQAIWMRLSFLLSLPTT